MARQGRDASMLLGAAGNVGRERDMSAEPVHREVSRREWMLFLLLAVVIWPFIAVGVVAGWGFLVWMYYSFTGPPGPV